MSPDWHLKQQKAFTGWLTGLWVTAAQRCSGQNSATKKINQIINIINSNITKIAKWMLEYYFLHEKTRSTQSCQWLKNLNFPLSNIHRALIQTHCQECSAKYDQTSVYSWKKHVSRSLLIACIALIRLQEQCRYLKSADQQSEMDTK